MEAYIRYILVVVAAFMLSCERGQDVVIPIDPQPTPNCPVPPRSNAYYEESRGRLGLTSVRITGYWFVCEGYFGQPVLKCRWNNGSN